MPFEPAREKAIAMAAELGQSLGKPWEVTEDESDIDASKYLNSTMRFKLPMQEEQTVAGGDVAIRATVRVSFQLL